jgi:hypothetical protein
VHKSLLNVILHDHMPDDNAVKPEMERVPQRRLKIAKKSDVGQYGTSSA